MAAFRIVVATDVDQTVLRHFLREMYGQTKSEFLIDHGAWWHRGQQNQWVVLNGEQIVAYCALIPTVCWVNGDAQPALWWIDLIVAPSFRGLGIQSVIDERMRGEAALKLGFPNELATVIHRRHGWGINESGHVCVLPLQPLKLNRVQQVSGLKSALLRTAALGMTPLAQLWQFWMRGEHSGSVRKLNGIRSDLLSDIVARNEWRELVTTVRDREFFRWRYVDAPYADELSMYVTGPADAPSHYLIVRTIEARGTTAMRVLDWYGDFSQLDCFQQLLRRLVSDAIEKNVAHIKLMSFLPQLTRIALRAGFIVRTTARFCWHGPASATQPGFAAPQHWVLGDSDNDEPV